MNKNIYLILILTLFLPITVFAEFMCESSVQYVWVKEEKENTVPYKLIDSSGMDEMSAKENLKKISFPIKQHAFEACIQDHQNYAACLATKLKSLTTTNANLGFEAKNLINDAIKKDCENMSGICKEAKMDEIICKEIIVKKEETEEDAEGDKKKGKKRK